MAKTKKNDAYEEHAGDFKPEDELEEEVEEEGLDVKEVENRHFEEVDYEAGGKARVSLELTLVRARDHKVVWSGRNAADAPLEGKGMAGVANAVNAAVDQLLRGLLPGLVAQVEQDFKASQGQSQ